MKFSDEEHQAAWLLVEHFEELQSAIEVAQRLGLRVRLRNCVGDWEQVTRPAFLQVCVEGTAAVESRPASPASPPCCGTVSAIEGQA